MRYTHKLIAMHITVLGATAVNIIVLLLVSWDYVDAALVGHAVYHRLAVRELQQTTNDGT